MINSNFRKAGTLVTNMPRKLWNLSMVQMRMAYNSLVPLVVHAPVALVGAVLSFPPLFHVAIVIKLADDRFVGITTLPPDHNPGGIVANVHDTLDDAKQSVYQAFVGNPNQAVTPWVDVLPMKGVGDLVEFLALITGVRGNHAKLSSAVARPCADVRPPSVSHLLWPA